MTVSIETQLDDGTNVTATGFDYNPGEPPIMPPHDDAYPGCPEHFGGIQTQDSGGREVELSVAEYDRIHDLLLEARHGQQ